MMSSLPESIVQIFLYIIHRSTSSEYLASFIERNSRLGFAENAGMRQVLLTRNSYTKFEPRAAEP